MFVWCYPFSPCRFGKNEYIWDVYLISLSWWHSSLVMTAISLTGILNLVRETGHYINYLKQYRCLFLAFYHCIYQANFWFVHTDTHYFIMLISNCYCSILCPYLFITKQAFIRQNKIIYKAKKSKKNLTRGSLVTS